MRVLQEESELDEIVRLVGIDALSSQDRLTMETAKTLREDYLHQNAFHDIDTYASVDKQFKMLKLIYGFYHDSLQALSKDAELDEIMKIPARERIGRCKYIEEKNLAEFDVIEAQMQSALKA